jgi:hypothetical protein
MRKHFDFASAGPNPYAKRLKKPVTIRLDETTISYFKALAEETELPLPESDQPLPARLRSAGAAPRSLLAWTPTRGGLPGACIWQGGGLGW